MLTKEEKQYIESLIQSVEPINQIGFISNLISFKQSLETGEGLESYAIALKQFDIDIDTYESSDIIKKIDQIHEIYMNTFFKFKLN